MLKITFFLICLLFNVNAFAESGAGNSLYSIDFGVVLQNERGQPVGFKPTKTIPLRTGNESTLYGVVVSRHDNASFILSAVHVLPVNFGGEKAKVMSEPMDVVGRGAIFLKTDVSDIVGKYQVEIYVDNLHTNTIDYELVKARD